MLGVIERCECQTLFLSKKSIVENKKECNRWIYSSTSEKDNLGKIYNLDKITALD